MRSIAIVCRGSLVLILSIFPLRAEEPLRCGLQVGLALPVSADLKVTSNSGPNPALGAHVEWDFWKQQTLRMRLDAEDYHRGSQVSDMPGIHQEVGTKVRTGSVGAELLHRLSGGLNRWSLGAGIYAIRWQVDSTNRLATTAGQFAPSGTSHWTREGLGVLAHYHWNLRTGLELRYLASHYGQENRPAQVLSTSLFWYF